MLQKIMNRNLLKYSAGHHIFCPKCNKIADYRSWVIWENPNGTTGAHCADCHREMLAKVHDDDKPHAYLVSIGWQFDTLVDFDKKPRKPAEMPQKAGKALDTYLRTTILRHHALMGFKRAKPVYPKVIPFGNITTNDDGEYSSPSMTAEYVARYCEANHLKAA